MLEVAMRLWTLRPPPTSWMRWTPPLSFDLACIRPSLPPPLQKSFGRAFTQSARFMASENEQPPAAAPAKAASGISRRIHILGLGNIGCFVAHSLRGVPDPPRITLLLHNENFYEAWKKKRRISVVKHGLVEHARGFDVSVLRQGSWYMPSQPEIAARTSAEMANEPEETGAKSRKKQSGEVWAVDDEPIDNLILSCKATQVEQALNSVAHRLSPMSTIIFMQNGMGTIEQVNEKIFPDVTTRPNYIVGIVSHGLYRVEPFKAVHTGMGTTALAVVHTNPHVKVVEQQMEPERAALGNSDFTAPETKGAYEQWAHSSRYLLSLLSDTPPLTATTLDKTSIISLQLEKLAMNCVINPLTVLFNCTNGELLYNFHVSRIQRLLLIELSAVVNAMPELQGVPGLRARFAPERLRTLAVGLMRTTSENKSSMLQDALGNRETEINYINGYVVKRGEELGIRCVTHYMMVQMVLGKTRMEGKRAADEIPLEGMDMLL